ncbi:MAG: hypothetical protein GPJ54_15010 [Candidatus Heimdallarchaeota archaeon]|nr:hypothetical protein [Candidatus Heimdallarchaeota archaeon]
MKKRGKVQSVLEEEKVISNFADLFQLWKDIPVVQTLQSSQYLFKSTSQPIQNSILKILRKGISDDNNKKRHFLTANELLEAVNVEIEGLQNAIKISMLYYHLDKLQEFQLVEFVYYIEGRHKRKYFGRTAKFYLFGDPKEMDEKVEQYFSPISKLILHYNPNADIEKYKQIVNQIRDEESEFSSSLVTWMRENHELLYELEIDALDIFTALTTFMTNQVLISQLFQPLKSDMKFLD